ncbi:uncharacterized protein LOC123030769 isoform X2 [Varanus komodoensis]|uniref:uncharacterized protein LOC123030769 isoform X2 n=1 Tax=Varanus komodoensis TaxID=61221 RepID=UPI001CF76DAD|nr:uncharacterized protein LOC123030769 isoform X2 [Varanus komodoensis]
MFSYKMEGFSAPLLMLMLTGHFTLSKAYTPPISEPFFLARPSNARSPEEVQVEKGMSLKITTFCEHKYFQGDKIWCREKHLKECDLKGPLSHSRSGWRYLTAQPNQKILLQHSTNGCVSLLMTNLQVEDSGIYWFGLLEGLEIVSSNKIKVVVHEGHIVPSRTVSPPTSSIPYFKSSKQENIEEVMKVEGESLSIEGFCSQQYIQAKKVWCKSELLKECNLEDNLSFSGPQWRLLTTESNQRVILKNSENGCIYFFMPALQVEDSGIYWFGILDGLHITHLRKIKVIVQNGQQNNSIVTATCENEQRVYHVVLVLGSIMVGITIIAALACIAAMIIKRKTRDK